jgi:acyl carrier protein phosphodiesterase
MNFLAHLYLSGDSDEIKLGNFIADYVKGKKYLDYPEQVALGIRIHRSIDFFTDQHPDVLACTRLLKTKYGKYSGVVTDVFFDHFLASNWNDYSVVSLRQFSKHAHSIFISNFSLLPFRVKQFLPFLIQHKRLESYANRENLFQVLDIMSRRTSLPDHGKWAVELLIQEYAQFEYLFRSFFAEIIEYVENEYKVNIPRPDISSEAV